MMRDPSSPVAGKSPHAVSSLMVSFDNRSYSGDDSVCAMDETRECCTRYAVIRIFTGFMIIFIITILTLLANGYI